MKTLAAISAIFFSACIIVPLPEHREEGRVFIRKEMLAFIVTGKTTRADVLLKLGHPDAVAFDEQVFIYEWKPTVGFAAVGGPGAAATTSINLRHFCLIAFDPANNVIKYEIIGHNIDRKRKPMTEFISEWLKSPEQNLSPGSSSFEK